MCLLQLYFGSHASVITVPSPTMAVVPVEIEMVGESDPKYRSLPVLVDAVPTAKKVAVAVEPVHAGKLTSATGDTEAPVTVNPPDVLATATLA